MTAKHPVSGKFVAAGPGNGVYMPELLSPPPPVSPGDDNTEEARLAAYQRLSTPGVTPPA